MNVNNDDNNDNDSSDIDNDDNMMTMKNMLIQSKTKEHYVILDIVWLMDYLEHNLYYLLLLFMQVLLMLLFVLNI